jgi:hypothetical protein
VHHLDGDHANNDTANLVLIECADHLMLHNGGRRIARIGLADRRRLGLAPKRKGRWLDLGDGNEIELGRAERARWIKKIYARREPWLIARIRPIDQGARTV